MLSILDEERCVYMEEDCSNCCITQLICTYMFMQVLSCSLTSGALHAGKSNQETFSQLSTFPRSCSHCITYFIHTVRAAGIAQIKSPSSFEIFFFWPSSSKCSYGKGRELPWWQFLQPDACVHRIIEKASLDGTSGGRLIQPSAERRAVDQGLLPRQAVLSNSSKKLSNSCVGSLLCLIAVTLELDCFSLHKEGIHLEGILAFCPLSCHHAPL